mmetsp:Transcript_22136/g.69936  ORF Transcript_22136/g.69936 Transcript_22136/m.69936 type:complete len:214 (-) Transcript_22136:98-739(-)
MVRQPSSHAKRHPAPTSCTGAPCTAPPAASTGAPLAGEEPVGGRQASAVHPAAPRPNTQIGQYQRRSRFHSCWHLFASSTSSCDGTPVPARRASSARSTLSVPARLGSCGTARSEKSAGSSCRTAGTTPGSAGASRATKAWRPTTAASATPSSSSIRRCSSAVSSHTPPTFTRSSARPAKARPCPRRSTRSRVRYQRTPSCSTKTLAFSSRSV